MTIQSCAIESDWDAILGSKSCVSIVVYFIWVARSSTALTAKLTIWGK